MIENLRQDIPSISLRDSLFNTFPLLQTYVQGDCIHIDFYKTFQCMQ
jgi:hypothetical protein